MTGRKIIGVYQILIVTSLAIELYMLSVCLRAAGEYAEVYPILQRGTIRHYCTVFLTTLFYSAIGNTKLPFLIDL